MLVQSRVSRSQAIKAVKARKALIKRLARDDASVFCEYVLKDERTGAPVVQGRHHRAWHRLCDEHDRLLIWAHIESGKTQQLSVGRTLWELGRNPNLRFLILSNTKNQARKVASVIRQYVETSNELHDVFPELQPGEPWGEYAFSVARSTFAKDPSIQTSGVHGNIQGSRLDRVVPDDVLDYENTQTEDQRKGLIDWYQSAVTGRLVDNARIRSVGTAFHPQDFLHWCAKQPGWAAYKYPIVDADGHPRWPEQWPVERIAARVAELGPVEAQRQLMCEARDDASARFKRDWIEVALRMGEGTSLASALQVVPPGYRIYTGVDLAVQQKDHNDLTVLFTLAIDPYGNRKVLNCESGKWSGPEIVTRIHSTHHRYQSIVIVENNAAQDFIRQFAVSQAAIPIIPFTTGRNKAHPEFGVESLATEMSQGKWYIPNRNGQMHPEIAQWVDEMLFYNPSAHTGDRLMASWFAREGARLGGIKVENPPVDFNRR
jgi:hypothetical protein